MALSSSNKILNIYETDEQLNMYLSLHYPLLGKKEIDPILAHANAPTHVLRFPQRVAELLCALLKPDQRTDRALDIGCAVGGAAFELAKTFDHVEAFDFSQNFVDAAKRMQAQESIPFRIPVEGGICAEVTATHEAGITREVLRKVNFFTADACKLKEISKTRNLGTFDGVIMSNLLCRLPDPIACLDGLPRIVNKGGLVLILTPYTWLEQFTPKCNWLGGYTCSKSDKPVHSRARLKELMEDLGFELIHIEQVPCVIREHQRKYQYIVSEATGWRKK